MRMTNKVFVVIISLVPTYILCNEDLTTIAQIPGYATQVLEFVPNKDLIAIGVEAQDSTQHNFVGLYDINTGQEVQKILSPNISIPKSIAFNSQANRMLLGEHNGYHEVDLRSNEIVGTFNRSQMESFFYPPSIYIYYSPEETEVWALRGAETQGSTDQSDKFVLEKFDVRNQPNNAPRKIFENAPRTLNYHRNRGISLQNGSIVLNDPATEKNYGSFTINKSIKKLYLHPTDEIIYQTHWYFEKELVSTTFDGQEKGTCRYNSWIDDIVFDQNGNMLITEKSNTYNAYAREDHNSPLNPILDHYGIWAFCVKKAAIRKLVAAFAVKDSKQVCLKLWKIKE